MTKKVDLESHNPSAGSLSNPDPAPKNLKKEQESVPFFKLFCCVTRQDWILILVGTIASLVSGAAMPLFSLLFGDVADSFGPHNSGDQVVDAAGKLSLKLLGVAVGSLVTSYLAFACWMISGERQAIQIRKKYFKSLLSQEIAFFDSINPSELSTKITQECFNIQGGIGSKVFTFLHSLSMFISGFIIGYIKGWQLALVLTGFIPFLSLSGSIFVISIQKAFAINSIAYSKAGAISEEALNSIRTVTSLGGQVKESDRYKLALEENRKVVTKFGVYSGAAMGSIYLAMLGMYALAFYIGSIFISKKVINPVTDEPYTGGDVLTVFYSIMTAGFTISKASHATKSFAMAKSAGAKAFKIIDRKSLITIDDHKGTKLGHIEGDIEFRDVKFAYPLKADRTILNGINFKIRKNEKTALVGESGCGKTTCMQLIERFYDLEHGSITLDGHELKNLNLKWMRENIGYVGQEPVLFATTIRDNLLMAKDDATDADIWNALRKANAADFVHTLPDKLDTFVGNSGSALSGGQKQRLAIARAILKDPKILLLDEATSALDRKNEMEIQRTLDQVSTGRTTIIIAHRLSTIINADHIIVFDQGKVVEEGKHQELVQRQGRYYALQHLQLQAEEKEALCDDLLEEIEKRPEEKPLAKAEILIDNKQDLEAQSPSQGLKDDIQKNFPTKEEKPKVFKRLFRYNKKDQPLIFIGLVVAFLNGCVLPSLAIVFSNMLEVLAAPEASDFRSRANLLSLMFLVLAILALLLNSIQISIFSFVGENLSRKVRVEVFDKYLRMPMCWFDLPENAPGALCSKLSQDATLINSLTSSTIGTFIQAFGSFASGMIYSFIASWQLALITLALSPLMMIAAKLQAKFSQGSAGATNDAYKDSIAFVAEAVNNMRTVASFAKEDKILENYSLKLQKPLRTTVKNGNLAGFFYGISQFFTFGIYAVVFYIGAVFIRDIDLSFQGMLQSIFGILFAAMGIGSAMQFVPDLAASMNAAIGIFKILDSKPAIDIDDPKQNVRSSVKGNIEFRNVSFKYPSREKQIFKNLSFKINASTKVALVGPSGCGKSTILALLQRFYDPEEGDIFIDGVNVKQYDLRHLRNTFGVVSQEPVLFNGTIEYNIKYAKENATEQEMKAAAEKANALSFIENNEFDVVNHDDKAQGTGFKRLVGPKGSQLSGGQKQRIAIARAILKNPSILILDEATSALDAQNEKSVQESLDKIMEGKTSVIVAHRISTIKDSDEILVFNDGEIIERGSYHSLNAQQGMFYKLERGLDLKS